MNNWILCPVRNGLRFTRDALPTFLAQDVGNMRVLIIDNDSSDGTWEWLASLEDDRVFSMRFHPPRSVAASWNAALRWIFEAQPIPSKGSWRAPLAEHAMVVNNDVLLRKDTYLHLLVDGGLFVTAVGSDDPKCVEPERRVPKDGEAAYDTDPRASLWYRMAYGNNENNRLNLPLPSEEQRWLCHPVPNPVAKRPHPDFSCYLIRRECWQRVGPFDEVPIAYTEDSRYHLRMHRAGIQAWCLDVPFYHHASGTISCATEQEAEAIREQAEKNRASFLKDFGVSVGSPEYYALFGNEAPLVSRSGS